MFKNNVEDKADFCEAYKAEILNGHSNQNDSSFGSLMLKILAVVLLVSIIVAASIYTYNYFLQDKGAGMPPMSVQMIEDDELIVKMEEEVPIVEDSTITEDEDLAIETEVDEQAPSVVLPPKIKRVGQEESDIEKMANDIKIEIAKKEEEERLAKEGAKTSKVQEKIIEVPLSSGESSYVEELAQLVKEVDKERK